jgi:hypothetical protein
MGNLVTEPNLLQEKTVTDPTIAKDGVGNPISQEKIDPGYPVTVDSAIQQRWFWLKEYLLFLI